MKQSAVILMVMLGARASCCFGQQIGDRAESWSRVAVGMLIEDAKDVLTRAEIPSGGAKAFAAHPAGDKWLFYTLKKGLADLVIQYSPRSGRVTAITVHYLTTPRSRTEIAVPATSIQFNRDGSYSIHFPPSKSGPSKRKKVEDVLPSKGATKLPATKGRNVSVDEIGDGVLLTGRLGEPLGTTLTVAGQWGYPKLRVKDYSLRFAATHVNGKELARPVVFPVHAVSAMKDGANAIPPHARHKELDGVSWTLRAYETGRFTSVPAEYWRERGAPAMARQPAFASQLVGFVRAQPVKAIKSPK